MKKKKTFLQSALLSSTTYSTRALLTVEKNALKRNETRTHMSLASVPTPSLWALQGLRRILLLGFTNWKASKPLWETMVHWFESIRPARHKHTHIYNANAVQASREGDHATARER